MPRKWGGGLMWCSPDVLNQKGDLPILGNEHDAEPPEHPFVGGLRNFEGRKGFGW